MATSVPRRTTLQAGETTRVGPGQPDGSELDLRARAVLGTAVAADLALRTAVASLVAGATAPWALMPGNIGRERSRLDFYAELAAERDAERAFPRPPRGIDVETTPGASRLPPPLAFRPRDGHVETLRFRSPFRALNPDVRADYARHGRNRTAVAQRWRHDDGPRPTLCVIHGFMASPYWLNSAFFSLPWFYGLGYDVLLYTLPFHGPRASRRHLLNGAGYFAHGVSHFNEAVANAVHDFRVFVDHLQDEGVEQIGLTGLSLGGYTTALLAAVDDRLAVAIPNAPVIDLPMLLREWFPAGQLLGLVHKLNGVPIEELERAVAVHSPLNYDPVIAHERLMIIGGLGDRLAPPAQSEALWEHWGQPRLHWYPGNHTLHVNRGAYLKEMGRFMAANGFGP
jgi:hypothetical protein